MPSLSTLLAVARRPQVLAVGTQLSGAGFAFVSFVLLARTLAPEDFGAWVLFLTASTFLDMVRHGLVQAALVQRSAGATAKQERALMGGAWVLGLVTTAALALGVWTANLFVEEPGAFRLFLEWYPLLAVTVLPYQIATWDGLARERFGRLLVLKLVLAGGFALFVTVHFVGPRFGLPQTDLDGIALAYIVVQCVASGLMLVLGWTRLRTLRHASGRSVGSLYRFGRYSVGTALGSNLLRSADQFILGVWLGPAAVAFYGVPQKLIEVVEIPLRGLAQTALPPLARLARRDDRVSFARYLHAWIGGLSLAFVPLLMVVFVWAEVCCVALAGEAYRDAAPLLRIFVVYMAMLPLDRYIGLSLDALGRPALNMIKVTVMVGVNIVGDIVVLSTFGSVEAVAGVTIVMTLVGVTLGIGFAKRFVPFSIRATIKAGPAALMHLLHGEAAVDEPRARDDSDSKVTGEPVGDGATVYPEAAPPMLSDGAVAPSVQASSRPPRPPSS